MHTVACCVLFVVNKEDTKPIGRCMLPFTKVTESSWRVQMCWVEREVALLDWLNHLGQDLAIHVVVTTR